MNIAYKIIMVIVGCFVAYYIMSLATESKKFVQKMEKQSVGGKSIDKISDTVRSIESEVKSLKKDLASTTKDNENKFNAIKSAEDKQEDAIQSMLDTIARDEEKQDAAIQKIQEVVGGSQSGFVSISKFESEKKEDDSREDSIENQLFQQGETIKKLAQENAEIKQTLISKTAEIEALKAEVKVSSSISKILEKSDEKNISESLKAVFKNGVGAGGEAYDGLQKELEDFKEATSEKLQEMNKSLQVRIDSLSESLKDSKVLTAKTLQNIEKSMDGIEKSTSQTMDDTKQWINSQINSLSDEYKGGVASDINIDDTIQKVTNSISVEIEVLKKELEGLQKKVETMVCPEKTEPVGIVVNKVFDKSLVMLNTAKGTYIFNPYADFTGVVRVRDEEGNEKMVLVPYTGEYLKIGNNIIDIGPFSRSCAQGINCNIDVRGSMNAPVAK